MDWSIWAPWIAIAVSIGSVAYTILSDRGKKHDERFAKIETDLKTRADHNQVGILAAKVDIVEDRITVVENDFKHLPDKETTHRLELSISEMRTEMRGLSEKMRPIAAMAERVQDAVLEKVMGQ
jgi:hypothetical protein